MPTSDFIHTPNSVSLKPAAGQTDLPMEHNPNGGEASPFQLRYGYGSSRTRGRKTSSVGEGVGTVKRFSVSPGNTRISFPESKRRHHRLSRFVNRDEWKDSLRIISQSTDHVASLKAMPDRGRHRYRSDRYNAACW